jgi:RNA polymerase sigma-70 factor (ECF subfamily)
MTDLSSQPQTLDRLMASMRPRLHRYCARIVGSAFDGEDVVQDAMLKAADAWPGDGFISRPEPWLFRIAHNAALDALRRKGRETSLHTGQDINMFADTGEGADARVAATVSMTAFMELSVVERSSVVMSDVLGYDLAETVDLLGLTGPAVKAALHRGRTKLQTLAGASGRDPTLEPAEQARLRAYADHFNDRDFDALRDLLAEDVRLDLVNRLRLAGRKDVSVYYSRYEELTTWRFAVGSAEGRPALLVSNPRDPVHTPLYVVLLEWSDGRITTIRDFLYATYVMEGLDWSPA